MKVNPKIKKYDLSRDDLDKGVEAAVTGSGTALETLYEDSVKNFEVDTILNGKVIRIINDMVLVDIGYKSEGMIPLGEFEDASAVDIGDAIEVLLEAVEDASGSIVLSKRKADRIRGWERLVSTNKEGDVVRGRVTRKIKGGLLVDVGVPVFLPASQVSLRRTGDVSEYVGREIEAQIIKIDESRMNIVVSRRKLLEEQREEMKKKLLAEIQEGEIREGIVKNIADFGAFVDLGGIDGLLHITDMSWGRVGHPSEVVNIDQRIKVAILRVDHKTERIALGLKQLTDNPWKDVDGKYPIGTRVRGQVVNIMSYGAFVKLEEGVEGLVHISEMSWTKRVNHPSEIVTQGDDVEVLVLDINKDKQEISLGIKQTEENPWTQVEAKYPPGTVLSGTVRNLTNYGAFVEIEEGIDGLLHVSDMSWTRKVNHPSEMLKKSDVLQTVVLSVDQNKKRVALGLKQLSRDPWELDIPNRYHVGGLIVGKITKLTNFGAFVELESDLEGLLHISEITDKRIKNPEEVVQVGQEVQCRIIKVDPNERKIGLSLLREGEETGVDLDEESGEGTGEIDSSAASEEATEADSAVEAEATTDAEPVEAAAETEVVAEADSGAETEVVAEADSGAETEDVAEAVVEEPVAVETEGEAEEDKKE